MMHQDREFVFGWDSKQSKRSSGLFSVLKWFGATKETILSPTPPPDLITSSSSSSESIESVYSTESVASFSFVPPKSYRPFGSASQPEKFILPGPETSTYRARLAQRDVSRETDRNLTLRSKYNLYKTPERSHNSLPLKSNKTEELMYHRRTASESSKHKKVGAYVHVKGKRKAPQPPGVKGDTMRRKKRLAPQPPNPNIIQNDTLKLDHGILKPAKDRPGSSTKVQPEITHVSPKPWYKRTLAKSIIPEKKPDVEKRKSGLSFLTNISELDRETMEILGKENLKQKYLKIQSEEAPAFMRPRGNEHIRTNSDSWIMPKRKSAKDLIAKFNAITGVSRVSSKESIKEKSQSPPIADKKTEFIIPITKEITPSSSQSDIKKVLIPSPIARTAVVKPISRSQWNCPKCTLENDYWRIICRVCSTIKPYFDDFTTNSTGQTEIKSNPPNQKPKTELFAQTSTEFSELQRSVLSSQYPKLPIDIKEEPLSVSETKTILSQYQKITPAPEVSNVPKLKEIKGVFQSQYPIVSLNYKFKNPEEDLEIKEKKEENISQPKYPRINLGINEEIELIQNKPNDSIIEITKNKAQTPLKGKQEVEKMILGDELGFKEPKTSESFLPVITKVEYKKNISDAIIIEDAPNVEKMILGDEIRVEKPDYINIKNSPKLPRTYFEKNILSDEASVKKSEIPRSPILSMKTGAISKTKLLDEEKKNSAKREEREKLKKILIEMKNSLPKRQNKSAEQKNRVSLIQEQFEQEVDNDLPLEEEKTAELIIATKETIYENIKVKNIEKPLKVSSSVQTNAVFRRNATPDETNAIKSNPNFQLIGAKDFVGITNEKTKNGDGHTYANLIDAGSNMPDIFAGCSKINTLEINRLLRRLEVAIAGGELEQAAVFATELAQLKVPLSVIRQKSNAADKKKGNAKTFNVDMYVEDKLSHRGPFPLEVTETMTVTELKILVEEKYKIPHGVQRWILGKQLAVEDSATLGEHQITSSGCPVFLYLVVPSSDSKTNQTEIIEIAQNIEDDSSSVENIPETAPLVDEENTSVTDEDLEENHEIPEEIEDLWKCRACTLLNPVKTTLCEACGLKCDQSNENKVENNQTYLQLVNLDNEDLVHNIETFECLVCLTDCPTGAGVTLRECLHQFCRVCLANLVEFSEDAEVKCPYRDNQYSCDIALQDREVKALVTAVVYEQHLAKSVKLAENKIDKTFHCKTPDCKGWCIYEDNVNDFHCPVCRKHNCLTCQAIHTGMNCKQYQEQMKTQSETDEDARRTRYFLEDMINRGDALACPTCQVVLLKKWGCDWLRCSMCKTEICWVTRGPRWGPAGKGDTTGGCKCGVNGTKCHPKCNYCH